MADVRTKPRFRYLVFRRVGCRSIWMSEKSEKPADDVAVPRTLGQLTQAAGKVAQGCSCMVGHIGCRLNFPLI